MPLPTVLSCLPPPLREEITHTLASPFFKNRKPAEIRMRKGRIASLTFYRASGLYNLPLRFISDECAIKTTFSNAVGGSLYAYEEACKQGYVSLAHGIRVGVSGRVFCKEGDIFTLSSVDSLVFRLPCGVASEEALYAFYQTSEGGILLFSPPGGGKTSLLRAFAARAAKNARVAVIDEREEFICEGSELLIDRLVGYPKAKGAEIAVRTLSPELLILDELGARDVKALASLVSFGVRTVASVHARREEEVLSSLPLLPLFEAGVFSSLWDVRASKSTPVRRVMDA